MNNRKAILFCVPIVLTVGTTAVLFAQNRKAFLERLSIAFSEALNEFDPDRQVRPAAVEILNANEFLSDALRGSLNEDFDSVPASLEEAEGALIAAGDKLLQIAEDEVFSNDAPRLQGELFFLVRDAEPETSREALIILGEACLENADQISNILDREVDIDLLRLVLQDVSSMRLAIASFYGLSELGM